MKILGGLAKMTVFEHMVVPKFIDRRILLHLTDRSRAECNMILSANILSCARAVHSSICVIPIMRNTAGRQLHKYLVYWLQSSILVKLYTILLLLEHSRRSRRQKYLSIN